ncbi:MAG: hypothetical protein V4850_29685 [Myxococcota bacterium]
MAKKSSAQRASKKHEKEKKRKKKLDARPPRAVKRDPVDDWKPGLEGIEGLAHRLDVGSHDAAHLAELVATHGRRADAKNTWLPGRVRALTTEQILAELATRGVVTDESTFVALAEAGEGARDLAIEVWKPMMLDSASPHDRDFVGEAAVALWERWTPHVVSDESLHDLLRAAFDQLEDGLREEALGTLCALWDLAREAGGLARLERADGRGEHYAQELVTLLDESADLPHELLERGLAVLRDVRDQLPAGHEGFVAATLAEARTLEVLGRPGAAIEGLVATAAGYPQEPDLLGEAVEILGAWEGASPALCDQLHDALTAARDAAEGKLRDVYDEDLSRLKVALAEPTAG